MPRRYRPPARRRKAKKERLQRETAAPPGEGARVPVPPLVPASTAVAAREERSSQVRHIGRDHSYVRGELRRIVLMVAFIIGGLLITAILR